MNEFFEPPPIHPNASFQEMPLLGTVEGVCGGDPIILGTRITCVHVWILARRFGMSVSDLVREYPQLRHEQVEEAIRFVDEHPAYVVEYDESWADKMAERENDGISGSNP